MSATIAFTPSDLTAILAVSNDWWTAFFRVAWETGQRRSDLLNLRWDQLDDDGTLRVVQAKSGVEFVCQLSPETTAAVRAMRRPEDRLIFSAEGRSVPDEWKSLLQRAGIDRVSLGELRSSALRRLIED